MSRQNSIRYCDEMMWDERNKKEIHDLDNSINKIIQLSRRSYDQCSGIFLFSFLLILFKTICIRQWRSVTYIDDPLIATNIFSIFKSFSLINACASKTISINIQTHTHTANVCICMGLKWNVYLDFKGDEKWFWNSYKFLYRHIWQNVSDCVSRKIRSESRKFFLFFSSLFYYFYI